MGSAESKRENLEPQCKVHAEVHPEKWAPYTSGRPLESKQSKQCANLPYLTIDSAAHDTAAPSPGKEKHEAPQPQKPKPETTKGGENQEALVKRNTEILSSAQATVGQKFDAIRSLHGAGVKDIQMNGQKYHIEVEKVGKNDQYVHLWQEKGSSPANAQSGAPKEQGDKQGDKQGDNKQIALRAVFRNHDGGSGDNKSASGGYYEQERSEHGNVGYAGDRIDRQNAVAKFKALETKEPASPIPKDDGHTDNGSGYHGDGHEDGHSGRGGRHRRRRRGGRHSRSGEGTQRHRPSRQENVHGAGEEGDESHRGPEPPKKGEGEPSHRDRTKAPERRNEAANEPDRTAGLPLAGEAVPPGTLGYLKSRPDGSAVKPVYIGMPGQSVLLANGTKLVNGRRAELGGMRQWLDGGDHHDGPAYAYMAASQMLGRHIELQAEGVSPHSAQNSAGRTMEQAHICTGLCSHSNHNHWGGAIDVKNSQNSRVRQALQSVGFRNTGASFNDPNHWDWRPTPAQRQRVAQFGASIQAWVEAQHNTKVAGL